MLKHLRVSVVLAAAALAACAPDSTGPDGLITTGGPALDLSDPPVVIDVLQRSEPLLHDFTAAGVIGRGGGVLRIPEAGFSITFPVNAVRIPTLVTVTAVPGTAVAYLFEPHGLVFQKSPVIMQDLRGTEVFGDPSRLGELEGTYFPDETALAGLTATIRETRPTQVDVSGWRMRFDVDHFSGYTASTHRGGYITSSGNLIPTER
ncbi:MAG TPA: hypothetical protein VGX50_12100 [Longimicrobium sp.]|jgi:hypothetical protein|nr:hypothetical protein [Longimicrobium sp.]